MNIKTHLLTLYCLIQASAHGSLLSVSNSGLSTSAEGITHDPMSGNILVSEGSNTLSYHNPWNGSLVSSFTVNDLTSVNGIDTLPNGNYLVSDFNSFRVLEIDNTGLTVSGGIDFNASGLTDFTGLSFSSVRNSIFAADQATSTIVEFSLAGGILNSFSVPAAANLEGLSTSIFDDHLYATSDQNRLLELSFTGDTITNYDLNANTPSINIPQTITDLKGITTDGGFIYIAHGTGTSQVTVLSTIPEPSSSFLFLSGLLFFSKRTR